MDTGEYYPKVSQVNRDSSSFDESDLFLTPAQLATKQTDEELEFCPIPAKWKRKS